MKLILAPFDPAAPGSHAQRMRMMELVEQYEEAQATGKGMARIARKINELVLPRLHTDDDSPVADALERVSANEYDVLVGGLFATAGEDAVPLESTATLTA